MSDAAHKWIEVADEDLEAARDDIAEDKRYYRVICFHAQQAVEKLIKAYLAQKGVDPPRVHDLERLIDLVEQIDHALAEPLRETAVLGAYAVASRYPSDDPALTADDAKQAVQLAERARVLIIAALCR